MRLASKSMPCESQLITNCDEFTEASGTNLDRNRVAPDMRLKLSVSKAARMLR